MNTVSNNNLKLYCKWGFDGSSGHSIYKQKFETDILQNENIFVTSLVPLRLIDSATNYVIWKNPRPSSTKFCRPLRLQWIHESKEVSKEEEQYINK